MRYAYSLSSVSHSSYKWFWEQAIEWAGRAQTRRARGRQSRLRGRRPDVAAWREKCSCNILRRAMVVNHATRRGAWPFATCLLDFGSVPIRKEAPAP